MTEDLANLLGWLSDPREWAAFLRREEQEKTNQRERARARLRWTLQRRAMVLASLPSGSIWQGWKPGERTPEGARPIDIEDKLRLAQACRAVVHAQRELKALS